MNKIIEVDVTYDKYVSVYLSLFSDSLHLTQTEEKVLEKIVQSYIELKDKVVEPYLTELVLSTERRKDMATSIGISGPDLNNRIKKLKDNKNIFSSISPLVIDPILVPSEQVTFIFNVGAKEIETLVTDENQEPEPDVTVIEDKGLKKEVKPIN